jgi:hypothetical protein
MAHRQKSFAASRRGFITLLGGAAAASSISWPFAAGAQEAKRVGVLMNGVAGEPVQQSSRYIRAGIAQARMDRWEKPANRGALERRRIESHRGLCDRPCGFVQARRAAVFYQLHPGVIPIVRATSKQDQFVLAALPPSQRQIRMAMVIVVTLVVAFGATAPLVATQLPRVDAFIPALETAIVFADLTTSALLFAQFSIARRSALLIRFASMSSSPLQFVNALTYPFFLAEPL